MKWLFRLIGLIFLVFALMCGVGYFLPSVKVSERTIQIDAEREDIFYYINDLQEYPKWSSLLQDVSDANIVFGGAEDGWGQTAVWQAKDATIPFGTLEIAEAQAPEFVRLDVNLAGEAASMTFAISRGGEAGQITVLLRQEISTGGFPYVRRIAGVLTHEQSMAEFDAALIRLKTLSENESDHTD